MTVKTMLEMFAREFADADRPAAALWVRVALQEREALRDLLAEAAEGKIDSKWLARARGVLK